MYCQKTCPVLMALEQAFVPVVPFNTPSGDLLVCPQVEGGCHRPEEAEAADAGLPSCALLCGHKGSAEGTGPQRGVSHCQGEPGQGPPAPGPRRESGHLLYQVSALLSTCVEGPEWGQHEDGRGLGLCRSPARRSTRVLLCLLLGLCLP